MVALSSFLDGLETLLGRILNLSLQTKLIFAISIGLNHVVLEVVSQGIITKNESSVTKSEEVFQGVLGKKTSSYSHGRR